MKKHKIYQLAVESFLDKGVALSEAKQIVADQAGKSWATIDRALRKANAKKSKKVRNVGVIGDTHLPYEHKDYLQFCIDTFKREKVTQVVHIGDLIDNHGLSFHDSEPGLLGARGEYLDAKERLAPWFKAFPKLTLVTGNHDLMAARKAIKAGIDPVLYMRPFAEVYEFPKGWDVVDDIVIDGVIYHHGETATGVNGFRMDAKNRMQSSVSGHNHSNCGVSYTATNHRNVFGVGTGCGVDNTSMAFAYGRKFKNKPVLGCAVIKNNGTQPNVYTMQLGEK